MTCAIHVGVKKIECFIELKMFEVVEIKHQYYLYLTLLSIDIQIQTVTNQEIPVKQYLRLVVNIRLLNKRY